jgi:hypothetical protein
MKIEPFKLERWLLEKAEYDLGGGGVVKLQLKDVTTSLDYDQYMKYGRTDGSDSLKRQVADWYDVDPDNILITSGTSEANLLVNLCLVEKGDGYLTEYPQYEQTSGFAKCLGAKVGSYHLDEESHWRLNLEELKEKAVRRTRIIFLDNPNNPTGALLTEDEMRAVCDVAGDVGAYVHCDNALRGSEADGKPALTPFGLYERGIVTGSISKLGATSPRIGWIIADRELIDRCWVMKDYTTLSHSGLGEYLAEIILSNRRRYIERNLAIRHTNTEMMSDWIRENGDLVSWTRPEAGFTAFPRYQRRMGSTEFCKRLLEEERILLSPGDHFGVDKHLRINIGSKKEVLEEALPRLGRFIESLPQ